MAPVVADDVAVAAVCDVVVGRGDAGTSALGGDDTNSVFQLTLLMIKRLSV